MATVLVTRELPSGSLEPLANHELRLRPTDAPYLADELIAAVSDVDAIVCVLTDVISAAVFAAAPRLRVVGNIAVGVDNIDLSAAEAAGVTVINTPRVLDETTADLTFTLILAATRACSDAERDLREGRWGGWSLLDHLGHDVYGSTLGLVGYGRVAQAVARRAKGFDMTVLHWARHPTGTDGFTADLDELLGSSDIVSLHVPLTPETTHLIGARELALLQRHAVLVNTARGAVVDEVALAASLHGGDIFAAGLDVYADEPAVHADLLSAPRTVLLPHIGSASLATRHRMALTAVRGVAKILDL